MVIVKWTAVFGVACAVSASLAGHGQSASDWKSTWEETVQAAKKEGRVVVYTFPGQELVFQEFQKKFPEIRFIEVSVRGSERIQRILAERRAGKYLADLLIGGVGPIYVGLYKTHSLDPLKPGLILPEVVDESKWWSGKHIYGDDERRHILGFSGSPLYYFHYNTKLIDPKDFKSYWDFLNPKWKGKIVMAEPLTAGTVEILQFLYHHPSLGPKFVRALLTEMEPLITRDVRQFLDWLATGKVALAFMQNANRVDLWEAKQQGLPVDTFDFGKFKEGILVGSGGGNIAMLNRAPHPNAAKVFVNWLLSREGQIAYQRLARGSLNSYRIDIPKDEVPPYVRLPEGVGYAMTTEPPYNDMEAVHSYVGGIWKQRR
jgi:iron(III) transport system substrate-binding protein